VFGDDEGVRDKQAVFDYIMYPNIKKYIDKVIAETPEANDRDSSFNMIDSITKEFVTDKVN